MELFISTGSGRLTAWRLKSSGYQQREFSPRLKAKIRGGVPSGGCWREIKCICQSTGCGWLVTSPQDVHMDLWRNRKEKKKTQTAPAQAISSEPKWGTSAGPQSGFSKRTGEKWQQSPHLCGRQARGRAAIRCKDPCHCRSTCITLNTSSQPKTLGRTINV